LVASPTYFTTSVPRPAGTPVSQNLPPASDIVRSEVFSNKTSALLSEFPLAALVIVPSTAPVAESAAVAIGPKDTAKQVITKDRVV
jgi:hypothetical protein